MNIVKKCGLVLFVLGCLLVGGDIVLLTGKLYLFLDIVLIVIGTFAFIFGDKK